MLMTASNVKKSKNSKTTSKSKSKNKGTSKATGTSKSKNKGTSKATGTSKSKNKGTSKVVSSSSVDVADESVPMSVGGTTPVDDVIESLKGITSGGAYDMGAQAASEAEAANPSVSVPDEDVPLTGDNTTAIKTLAALSKAAAGGNQASPLGYGETTPNGNGYMKPYSWGNDRNVPASALTDTSGNGTATQATNVDKLALVNQIYKDLVDAQNTKKYQKLANAVSANGNTVSSAATPEQLAMIYRAQTMTNPNQKAFNRISGNIIDDADNKSNLKKKRKKNANNATSTKGLDKYVTQLLGQAGLSQRRDIEL